MDAQAIFKQFKALYPNSSDVFSERVNSVAAWSWAIKQHQRRPNVETVNVDISDSDKAQVAARVVNSWDGFTPRTKSIYLMIADHFAGVQVYGVGSRVNGTWIDEFSKPEIKALRQRLGKAPKEVSDFDFTLSKTIPNLEGVLQKAKNKVLMYFAVDIDLLRNELGQHKIKIPMWNFDRLTDEQKAQARIWYEAKNWGKLMLLHNTAKLSPNNYCCDETPILNWYRWAYENGKI